MATPDNLKFEIYDDPETRRYTHLNNGETWKGILSLEDYVEREKVLGESEISQKNTFDETKKLYPNSYQWLGLKYFKLTDETLPATDKFSKIASSCETLNRVGYCVHPGSNGNIEPCLVVCIGGVYTPPKNRGKGYAKAMIEGLNKFYEDLRNQKDAPPMIKNLVINLYSEVDSYYERVGYYSMHVPLHNISKLDDFYSAYCQGRTINDGKYLAFDDYNHLVELQDQQFRNNLTKLQKKCPNDFIFTVKPDLDIFKWFQYRDVFIMKKTGKGTEDPAFGYELSDKSHIIWHHNWNGNCLIITKVYINESDITKREQILKKLMAHAIVQAKRKNLSRVQFWDEEIPIKEYVELNKVVNNLEDKSQLYVKNGSISAVKPPPGFTKDSIQWDNNTKFCWF